MDTVNLSGMQSTPSECKNYAGIRTPAGCACCALKDYPQNFPQAYCFTALCPGLSKCKSSQDHPQDNLAIPHPFFSSFPFQQHFFHNSIIPPNFCCFQKLSGDEGTNPRNEHQINQHQAPQKERSDLAGTNRNANEGAQKNNPVSGSETNSSCSNPTESQPNTVFQRCVCGDSLPWACRPFIVPVLSYCFLWNSQAAASLLPKTYNGYLAETLCQKSSKKETNQKYSCESDCPEQLQPVNHEPEKAACVRDHETVEISQESLQINELSKTELKTEKQEESTEQEENECVKNDSDGNYEEEEDESETGDDSELRDETESVESLKVDESDNPAGDSSENISKDLDKVSSTNLKSVPKSSEQSLDDASSENPENFWVTGVKDMNPSYVSKEESPDSEEPDTSKTNPKEVVVKKCIKNFTVTDKFSGAPSKELQMSAAGDRGGESCDGCKIRTLLDEKNEEISKESHNTDVAKEESEPKISLERGGKILQEIQSSGFKFKSGIAKLSNISSLRSSKSKITKKCKSYSNEKQSNSVKLKHCCFSNKNANSKSESSSRFQKPKKCTLIQNPAPGPEIQKKSLNTRQILKKENISRKPGRAVNLSDNSQKADKTLLKK